MGSILPAEDAAWPFGTEKSSTKIWEKTDKAKFC